MKEKIIAAIKAMFPGINLSKKRLEAIAAKIETKVIDDETKIDESIKAYNDFNPLADIAKQDDTIRDLQAKLKAPAKKDEPVTGTETVAEPEIPSDAPAWAKTMMEQNKKLSDSIALLQKDKSVSTIQSQLKEKLKDANPLVNWADWKQPETDEEVTPFIEKVTAKSKELDKTLTEKGLAALAAPKQGTQSPAGTPAVSASLKQTLEAQNKTQQAAAVPANGKSFVINTPGTL